ncbi:SWI5-dependent HO expression protein 4 [Dimargaris verticillata]|uniref:SWI5-dependent HO expression protein 4 n=1 Tax=Dimargaris verticillata TaxID=2761393 RepID=A0A9W8E8L4_9FUNG|nr:SWI5-dependent HO expression protein 4 [Dimargaris verticillata]
MVAESAPVPAGWAIQVLKASSCHGAQCARLVESCQALDAEDLTNVLPDAADPVRCHCQETLETLLQWVLPQEPQNAATPKPATGALPTEKPMGSLDTATFGVNAQQQRLATTLIALASVATPSPVPVLIQGLFPQSFTSDASRQLIQHLLLTQLATRPMLNRILSALAEQFAQSDHSDWWDAVMHAIQTQLTARVHSSDDTLARDAIIALTGFLATPQAQPMACHVVLSEGLLSRLFDALEYESLDSRITIMGLVLATARHRECVEKVLSVGETYLRSSAQPLLKWAQTNDAATMLPPHEFVLEGLVTLCAVAQLTLTARLLAANADPSLPLAPVITAPILTADQIAGTLRALTQRLLEAHPDPLAAPVDSDYNATMYCSRLETLEQLLESSLFCLFTADLRAQFRRDRSVWAALGRVVDIALDRLDQLISMASAWAVPIVTSTWSFFHTVAMVWESVTRYPPVLDDQQKQAKRLRTYAQRAQEQKASGSAPKAEPTLATDQLTEAQMTDELMALQRTNPQALQWWSKFAKQTTRFWKQHVDHRTHHLTLVCTREGAPIALSCPAHTALAVLALVAQTHVHLATAPGLRGTLAQHGAVTYLLDLVKAGNAMIQEEPSATTPTAAAPTQWVQRGYTLCNQATLALAKLAISLDPNVAYTYGQARSLAPALARLLKPPTHPSDQRTMVSLGQFEAMMALTNLACLDHVPMEMVASKHEDSTAAHASPLDIRSYIAVTCQVLPLIELLILDQHPLVSRAATEALCNLMFSDAVFSQYAESCERFVQTIQPPDPKTQPQPQPTGDLPAPADHQAVKPFARCKIHVLVALTSSDDVATQSAASGALAILTSHPIAAWALYYHPNGLRSLFELLGATCDDNDSFDENGWRGRPCLVPQSDTKGSSHSPPLAYLHPDWFNPDSEHYATPGLQHRALECVKNLLTHFPTESNAYRRLLEDYAAPQLVKEVVQGALRYKVAPVAQAGMEVLKLVSQKQPKRL